MYNLVDVSKRVENFNLRRTMESGQALCFLPGELNTEDSVSYCVISGPHTCYVKGYQITDTLCDLVLSIKDRAGELEYWERFFSIDAYGDRETLVTDRVIAALNNEWVLGEALKRAEGVRLIREDPWQAAVASYLPTTWSVETRRNVMTKICSNTLSALNVDVSPILWHFPLPDELLAVPLCWSPLKNIGPSIQRLCKRTLLVADDFSNFSYEAGGELSETFLAVRSLTDHGMNTSAVLLMTGFHYSDLYTEDDTDTAWMTVNRRGIQRLQDQYNEMWSYNPVSPKALLYFRIKYACREEKKMKTASKKKIG